MEQSFGLSLASLGLASAVIGGAEISGELVVGWAVDHFGKRPVIITTGALTALTYLVMPLTQSSLTLALVGLFVVFFFFEITLVGGIPLMTELAPKARGVVMATGLAASGLGRAGGAWIGPLLRQGGAWGPGLFAGSAMLVAVLLLAVFIREAPAEPD
jgi:predicted MFS family arabinose efflux permease